MVFHYPVSLYYPRILGPLWSVFNKINIAFQWFVDRIQIKLLPKAKTHLIMAALNFQGHKKDNINFSKSDFLYEVDNSLLWSFCKKSHFFQVYLIFHICFIFVKYIRWKRRTA